MANSLLIVDDEKNIRNFIEVAYSKRGFQVLLPILQKPQLIY